MRIFALLVGLAAFPAAALAQIATDGSMGAAGPVGPGLLPDGRLANYRIDESLGRREGGNLFHSFATFGVPARTLAAFTAELPTERVLARVTGLEPSTISGRLASVIPGADLYLINPRGVLFSGGSSFEVQGSFHVSTADRLRLADGTIFSASLEAGDPTLSAAAPAAWGFLSDVSAPITIRACAVCEVPAGETFSAVAGAIQIRGQAGVGGSQLYAPGGQILLAARASAGEIPVDVASLDARGAAPGSLGSVRVDPGASLVVSEPFTGLGERGRIAIRSGTLTIDQGGLFAESSLDGVDGAREIDLEATESIDIANGTVIRSLASADASGGAVRLASQAIRISASNVEARALQAAHAGSIELDADSVSLSLAALVGSTTGESASSGSIRVRTGAFEVVEGAQLSSTTDGSGPAGDIDIAASRHVLLSGRAPSGPSGVFSRSGLEAATAATGAGGDVTILSPEIRVEAGAEVSTRSFGDGDAGSIRLVASEAAALSGVGEARSTIGASTVRGAGGDVVIETPELSVANGSEISVSTLGSGDAGSVRITAERVYVGGGAATTEPAGIFAQSNDQENLVDAGNAGDVEIRVSRLLELRDGGIISASTRGAGEAGNVVILGTKQVSVHDGEISARSTTSGRSGAVRLDGVGTLSIGGLGRITTLTSGTAPGGQIDIHVSREVVVADGGEISAKSELLGDAGSIRIWGGQRLTLRDGGRITTQAERAFGGNIELGARHMLYLKDGEITTSVDQGAGNGGNISIDPEFVVLNGGTITANANAGNGGNILIRTDHFVLDAASTVEASSQLGIDGEIEITSPEADLTGELAELDAEYLDPSSQLARACAARSAQRGTFSARGAVGPSAPDAPLDARELDTAAPEGCGEPKRP